MVGVDVFIAVFEIFFIAQPLGNLAGAMQCVDSLDLEDAAIRIGLSLIHISEPTRQEASRMPSSA